MVVSSLRSYFLLVWMWMRAAWQYRTSLVLITASRTLITGADLVVVLVLFSHTRQLGSFGFADVLFLYGTSYLSMGLSELAFGDVSKPWTRIRTGAFDAMLIRPTGTLVQIAAEDFTPRRMGASAQGVGVLAVAIALADVAWGPARILMVGVMVVSGAVIFGSIWVLGGAFQFFAGDAAEVVSAFTSGGNTISQYPLSIFDRQVMHILTWVVPLAFINWQPALYVLGRTDPLGLPLVFRFASPVVAAVLAVLAGLAWRIGVRHYRSSGS